MKYIKNFDSISESINTESVNEGLFGKIKLTVKGSKFAIKLKSETLDFVKNLGLDKNKMIDQYKKLGKNENATDKDFLKVICDFLDSENGPLNNDKIITAAHNAYTNDKTKDFADIMIELLIKARHAMAIRFSYKDSIDNAINNPSFLGRVKKKLSKASNNEEKSKIMIDWTENELSKFYKDIMEDVLSEETSDYIEDYLRDLSDEYGLDLD